MKTKIILIVLVALFFASCEKDDKVDNPVEQITKTIKEILINDGRHLTFDSYYYRCYGQYEFSTDSITIIPAVEIQFYPDSTGFIQIRGKEKHEFTWDIFGEPSIFEDHYAADILIDTATYNYFPRAVQDSLNPTSYLNARERFYFQCNSDYEDIKSMIFDWTVQDKGSNNYFQYKYVMVR